jgi:uncharacterized protein
MTADSQATIPEILQNLHRIHRQLSDLNGRLARGPQASQVKERQCNALQQRLDEVRKQKNGLEIDSHTKQNELTSGEDKVKKRTQQLQEAKDNKEYQALQHQIEADKMANSVLADEALEMMERVEKFQLEVSQAETNLEEALRQLEGLKAEFAKEEPTIQADNNRLKTDLTDWEKQLPVEYRELYHRQTDNHGEDGLATIDGEFCTGCRHQVPLNFINQLMLQRPTFCRSCGRLLYLPEDKK